MAPQNEATGWVLDESDAATEDKDVLKHVPPSAEKRTYQIIWWRAILLSLLHAGAVYGGYIFFTRAMWFTRIFAVFLHVICMLGVTAGVHRLFTHKAYKARLPLRVMLVFFHTIALQESVLQWVRDHRTHHKFSETDADPHNATRGFFYSHMGWILVHEHPLVEIKARSIDFSDVNADPVLQFQKKYYWPLMTICCFILPSLIPTYWGESVWNAFFVCADFRFIFGFNMTALINSYAHMWGSRPYDQNIKPTQIRFLVGSLAMLGEGFHNYHHTFPWDYKAAEFGGYSTNFTAKFIDAMAKIGWAYDLKTVSPDIVERRAKRTGDGSHRGSRREDESEKSGKRIGDGSSVWGWDDATSEQKAAATILNPEKIE